AFLKSIGASQGIDTEGMWDDLGPCQDGDTVQIDQLVPGATKDAKQSSSMFQKMQLYLGKPAATYGPLGPDDFIVSHAGDDDFYRAYFGVIPYQIFRDPASNPYVTPEGQGGVYGPGAVWKMVQDETTFHKIAASIDRGEEPFEGATGPHGTVNATAF